jgi:AmmeMemoRadiSam system protein B/AmmeMemoRadiSam system protein A
MNTNRGARVIVALSIIGALALPVLASRPAEAPALERPPAVAGKFYPADAAELSKAIEAYLDAALPPRGARPVALIAPHAGYHYSGQIAADAFRQAADHEFDLVVILGANHSAPAFDGVSVYGGAGYRTPLGLAALDRPLAEALAAADEAFRWRPRVHQQEHSVEVHVPFVQTVFPKAKIVTAVVGTPDPALCARFGKALARLLQERKALIVASSDLSHYPGYDDAVAADRSTLAAMATLDSSVVVKTTEAELRRGRPGLSTCACGKAPVLAAISAARALGATRAEVISYANSGDVAIGDPARVVGYGAVTLLRGKGESDTSALRRPPAVPADQPLSADEKKALLAFARHTIERYLDSGTLALARGFAPTLARKQGVFVTLKKDGQLRGCIGHRDADRPLAQVVGAMALQAAFNDRRFRPVRPEEMEEIEVEISLLTPLVTVKSVDAIELGRDGIFLTKNGRAALYLPEVAVEQGWNREETMQHLCRKAGLPPDAWRDGAELQTFRTVLITESGEH